MTRPYLGAKRDTPEINKQVRHIMKIEREKGIPQRYYIGADGFVKVAFNGRWWDYHDIEAVMNDYKGWEAA